MSDNTAKVELTIGAPAEEVWKALTTPDMISRYMDGARVISDWEQGSSITWSGEWDGKPFEDRGEIVVFDPPRELKFTHCTNGGSPHVVEIRLNPLETGTSVALTQERNSTEQEKLQAEKNWNRTLSKVKQILESGIPYPVNTPGMKQQK